MALVEHGKQARFVEYACSEATVGFVLRHVLPLAYEELNVMRDTPGAHGILGASMGGLMALYTAFRLPDVFGKVLSQSGAFGFDLEGQQMVVYDLIGECDTRPLKVWMDVGRYEFLYAPNQRMRDLMRERGYAVQYREFAAGHNYTAWRDDIAHGLEAMFGA
jgi:enterochelin esterase family protein